MKGSSTTVGSIVEGQRYLLLLLLLLLKSPYSSMAKEKASDSAADRHDCPPDISLGKLDRVNAEAP